MNDIAAFSKMDLRNYSIQRQNFNGNFEFSKTFSHFIKFSSKFGQRFRTAFYYTFLGGSGGRAPEACEFIKKLVEKSNETIHFWKFSSIMRELLLEKANFNNN